MITIDRQGALRPWAAGFARVVSGTGGTLGPEATLDDVFRHFTGGTLDDPLSYEVDALRGLLIGIPTNLALDVIVLIGSAVAAIIVASALLPRLAK